jgi:hypothetical protein
MGVDVQEALVYMILLDEAPFVTSGHNMVPV